ncbi:Ras- protein rsr1 [Ascosphaera pollenicola]|nr:Ras- protein rsr1 [Ascosphaera pollenicola]
MVLLTPSAVSTLVSTSIILVSTIVLFLAGYKIQQDSIQSLQRHLREESQDYYANYGNPILNGRQRDATSDESVADDDQLPQVYFPSRSASRVAVHRGQSTEKKKAHLQLLNRPSTTDFCSALLYFDLLASNGSIESDHVLIYPASVETRMSTKDVYDILNRLRTRDVILHAVDVSGAWGRAPAESKILEAAATDLITYDQIFYIRAPGIILDVEHLDNYFLAKPMTPDELLKERKKYEKGMGNSDFIDLGQTWLTSRLSMSMSQLPAAFMTSRHHRSDGRSNTRAYVPSAEVRRSFVVPSSKVSRRMMEDGKRPAYAYFERDEGQRVRGNEYLYEMWRNELTRVCPETSLDD